MTQLNLVPVGALAGVRHSFEERMVVFQEGTL
jgi:hypothetical protein